MGMAAGFPFDMGRHQIPAHKHERGGGAGIHVENDLADRRATDKWHDQVRHHL
jgi:hypothetical protein